jgi:hypothetical protein
MQPREPRPVSVEFRTGCKPVPTVGSGQAASVPPRSCLDRLQACPRGRVWTGCKPAAVGPGLQPGQPGPADHLVSVISDAGRWARPQAAGGRPPKRLQGGLSGGRHADRDRKLGVDRRLAGPVRKRQRADPSERDSTGGRSRRPGDGWPVSAGFGDDPRVGRRHLRLADQQRLGRPGAALAGRDQGPPGAAPGRFRNAAGGPSAGGQASPLAASGRSGACS